MTLTVPVTATNLCLTSFPLFVPSNNVGSVIGTQLVGGVNSSVSDQLWKWDAASRVFVPFWKNGAGQWRQVPQVVATTNTLSPGEGFFIVNRHPTNQVVQLNGMEPDDASRTVLLQTGLVLTAYSYPSPVAISNLSLVSVAKRGASLALSDNLLRYDPVSAGYVVYWFPTQGGVRRFPQVSTTVDVLPVGEGFFYYRRDASVPWTELKP